MCTSTGDRELAVVRARQQERQHLADRLRQDADTAAGHQDQPHVRMGGGQPRRRLPDRHQQSAGHFHRNERGRGGVPGHAHRSHGPVRNRVKLSAPAPRVIVGRFPRDTRRAKTIKLQ